MELWQRAGAQEGAQEEEEGATAEVMAVGAWRRTWTRRRPCSDLDLWPRKRVQAQGAVAWERVAVPRVMGQAEGVAA